MSANYSTDLTRQALVYRHVSPSAIPTTNLEVWLRADAITGLADGDPIDTWHDQSGNSRNFVGIATARPLYKTGIINGKPVARFDGSNDEMNGGDLSAAFPSAASMFVVYRCNGTLGDYSGVFEDANRDIWWRFSGNGYFGMLRTARITNYPPSMPNTGSHYITVESSASAYQAWIDGVAQTAQAAAYAFGALTRIGRGANGAFNGDIAELILYSAAVDATTRGQVHTYLATKYGL